MTNSLELALLGQLYIKRAGQLLNDQLPLKGQALLVYLAVTGQPYTRSALAGLLWGDMPEETARTNLRLTLSRLRQSLGDVLVTTRQRVAFNFEQPHWLDVAEFEQLLEAGHWQSNLNQAHRSAPATNSHWLIPNYQTATTLYRGDFLDDFHISQAPDFELWLLAERERLRLLGLKALTHLAEAAQQQGDFSAGIDLTHRLLALEPWREESHRQLMTLLACSGQRNAALTQYDICRRLLLEALDVEPAAETVALYERIKTGRLSSRESEPQGTGGDTVLTTVLPPPPVLPLTPFIGREDALTRLGTLLAQPNCRLLTLVGPGGVGKTRLAQVFSKTQELFFPDGVKFISLVGLIPATESEAAELLIGTLAAALNCTFNHTFNHTFDDTCNDTLLAQQPPREVLLTYLADKTMLLLLDNFDPLCPAANFLSDILHHAPQVKLLVTSRERLGLSAEWLFDVPGLPYAEGHNDSIHSPVSHLFSQHAQRIKPDFEPAAEQAAISRICRIVAGSPLGIELAANWVRTLNCADIATRLAQSLDILETSTPGTPDRHRSMRSVLDASWVLLTASEQRAFRSLAIFRGDFAAEAAEAVAGVSLALLARLMDKSLVQREADERYRLYDLVQQYATGHLTAHPAEQKELKQVHSRYFAAFIIQRQAAFEHKPDSPALAEVRQEIENIRAAWEWLLANPDLALIEAYLTGLWYFYQRQGWFQEAIFMLKQALSCAGLSALQQGRWHYWLGEAHYQMGQIPQSRIYLEQALAHLNHPLPQSNRGLMVCLSKHLLGLGQVRHRLRLSPATVLDQTSKQALIESVWALVRLGQLSYFSGDPFNLITCALCSLNLAEQLQTPAELSLGTATMNLAMGHIPYHPLAEHYCRLTLKAIQKTDNLLVKAYAWQSISLYYINTCRWAEAEESLGQALILFEILKHGRHWAETLTLFSAALYFQGKFQAAWPYYSKLYLPLQAPDHSAAHHWALAGQAECALRLGNIPLEQILAWLEEAATLPQAQDMRDSEAIRFKGLLALTYLRLGQMAHARQAARQGWHLIQGASIRNIRNIRNTRNTRSTRSISGFWVMEGYAGIAETLLSLWELWEQQTLSGSDGPPDSPGLAHLATLKSEAQAICRALQRFARTYWLARPRSWLLTGWYHRLNQRPAKAAQAFRTSLHWSEKLAMPYEAGLAHYEIGRHCADPETTRQAHLQQAQTILAGLGAAYDLARVEMVLTKPLVPSGVKAPQKT